MNGKDVDFADGESVAGLLKRMNYVFPLVVVKIYGVVVPKAGFGKTIIPDGAVVEVIHLISGG